MRACSQIEQTTATRRLREKLFYDENKSGGDEFQSYAVIAPALTGGFRAIVEYVTLVAATASAVIFSARQQHFEVTPGFGMAVNRGIKAGPTGAAIEFGTGFKQRQITSRTDVYTITILLIQAAAEGAFGRFFSEHVELFRRQSLSPFGFGFVDFLNRLMRFAHWPLPFPPGLHSQRQCE